MNAIREKPTHLLTFFIETFPIEAVGFIAAAAISRIGTTILSAPFIGISIGITAAKLALKTFNNYDDKGLIYLTKKVCKFNQRHQKTQLIAFIASLIISSISSWWGLIAGNLLGFYGGLLIDVERYKLMQQLNRLKIWKKIN